MVNVSSGGTTGRLLTLPPTRVDVNSGSITTASLVDEGSLMIGVTTDSGEVVTTCPVCVELKSGNSSKASVVNT